VPGALAVATLIFGVRERRAGPGGDADEAREEPPAPAPIPDEPAAPARPLPKGFWRFLGIITLFTLGNATDAFLLLRATDLGVPVALVPVLWAFLHLVKAVSSTPGGALSDRLGRKPLIVAGWLLYAAVYAGFAYAGAAWHVWALFAVYGLYHGLVEGAERALVADLVGTGHRGAAFGWYHLAIGIAALPASVLFGWLWMTWSPAVAFGTGAALAGAAALLLSFQPASGRE
jgi:MFS family permease